MKERAELSKNIGYLKLEDHDAYLGIPGWRIWARDIESMFMPEYVKASDKVEQKPFSLICVNENKGFDFIDERYREWSKRRKTPLGGWYLLEPLSQEEFRDAQQNKTLSITPYASVPNILLQPEELKRILQGSDK